MPFQFFFPVPGPRAGDDTSGSPVLIDTPSDSHDDSPFSDPGSKAERVLGTLEPAYSQALSNKSSRKGLRSHMNVTRSGAEHNMASAKDGFPFPDMPGSRDSSRRPSHNLRNQGSSPLLGERFFKGSPGTDSTTNSPSPRPHFYGSSSTLRSYYDPAKSPLSISQQTSASSARDMALRKGCPSFSSPLSQDVSSEASPSAVQNKRRTATERAPGWRPAHADLLDRFRGTRTASTSTMSPNKVADSQLQLSHSNSQQSASSGRPNWWKRKKAKQSKSKEQSPSEERRIDQFDLGLDSLKTNIRKPKAGTKYWFDRVGNGNNASTIDIEGDVDEIHTEFWNKRLDELRPGAHSPEQRDVCEPSLDGDLGCVSPADAKCTTRTQHAPEDYVQTAGPDPPSQLKTRSRSSTISKADLSNQSFLELSSSSDEETDEAGSHSSQQEIYRRHRMRDNVDQNATGADVLVNSGQKIRPIKPKPVVNTSPRKSKRGSEVIPPVPKIPERPQLQQRVSSMKWRNIQNLKSPTITTGAMDESTCSSGGASITSQTSSYRHAGRESQLKKSAPVSKVMTVTVEEGELLEAMRHTRASLRQNAFAEGYTKAFRSSRNMQDRPRTSGTDRRVSYQGSERSASPSPSMCTTNASPQSFRFPEVPSSSENTTKPFSLPSREAKPPRQAPPIIYPPPKASPTESFSPSDVVASTPRSRLSPLTPSFITQEDDLHNTFGGIEDGSAGGKRGVEKIEKAANGHQRKRTVSSGVVMLDGMEERARAWEIEEEWLHGKEERW
ncbi:MAG: hypothetical protein LQ344_001321 [Seirophora lacunosa]|nr:MAG: hypothetical protein LQ344_001321 [Seirophora lacunosa]